MKYALFFGCNIPVRLSQYADATTAVCQHLGIDLIEIPDFNCCGYPVRNQSMEAFVASAARNLALAETYGADLLVMCKCCFGTLKMAQHLMASDAVLRQKICQVIFKEGLEYRGTLQVKHLLTVLHRDVGLEMIRKNITNEFQNLSIAASYGCHALRPSSVTRFDDPLAPTIFDDLVEATGAHSIEWHRKSDCCGAPLLGVNDELSIEMMIRKVTDARGAGADYLCTACPFTHLQLDHVQKEAWKHGDLNDPLPPILYPQLLGLSMGIDGPTLGMEKNEFSLNEIYLSLTGE